MTLIRLRPLFISCCIAACFFCCSLSSLAQPARLFTDSVLPMQGLPAKLHNTDIPVAFNVVNSNTCNTSTFRLRLTAGPGQKIDIKDVLTLADGNFLLAGNSFSSPANSKGLICILNNAGALQLQKDILVNNSPVSIHVAKATYNGTIFITGSVQEGTGKVFLASLNTALLANWVTVLDMGQVPLKMAMTYINDSSLVIAAQFNNEIKYALLNGAGTVQWVRQYSPAGMNSLAGVGHNENSQVSLVVNCTRSGKQVTEIVSFNQTTGAPFSIYTAGNPADEYQFGKVTSFSNRFSMTGVIKLSNGQYKLIRKRQYNASNSELTNTYELPFPAGLDVSSASDVAGDAPAFCFAQLGKLVFVRHFLESNTEPEHTRSYDVGTGSSIAGVSRSLTDGGYLFGLNTQSQDSIILIKTDSIGILAGCGFASVSNIHTETLGIQNTVSAFGGGNATAPATTGIWQQNNTTITTITECNQYYCPPAPPEDPCLTSYYKTFRSSSFSDYIWGYELMRNNTHLILSAKYDRILGNNNRLTYSLRLLSEPGEYIKGKTIYTNGISSTVSMRKVDDQHAMLVQYSTTNQIPNYTFTLLNDSLNILWSKSIEVFTGLYFPSGINGNITRDTEGNFYYVTVSPGFSENVKMVALKMDAGGNILWTKVYQLPISLFVSSSATVTPSGLVIVMEGYTSGSVSVRLDKTTGEYLNGWNYQNHSGGSSYSRYLQYENGYIWYCGNRHESNDEKLILMLFDPTGFPIKMKMLNAISSLPRAAMSKNGKLNVNISYYEGTQYKEGLLQTDTSFVPGFFNTYDFTRYGYSKGVGVSDNGALYMAGSYFYGGDNGNYTDPYIRKTDAAGVTGICAYQPANLTFTTIPITAVPIGATLINQNINTLNIPVAFIPDTFSFRLAEILCSSSSLCTSVQITGPQVVCQLNQPFTYISHRNTGCNLRPTWAYDTAFATLQSVTDTSATFIYRRTGITKLYAKINTGCIFYTDSIEVNIQYSPAAFTLGADKFLCPGDSVILNAGTGFNSYLWQDGSTDAVFVVHGPGQYHIQTSNLCGNVYTDTINVSPVIIPPLNIGPDAAVCTSDTLRLQAQPGFASYNWFPANLVTGNGQQAYTIPAGNMNVWVTAVTPEGCKKADTLSITSISAPPLFLGRDTSFCINDSVILNAGTGYQQYIWSTGSAASSVTVKQAGTYWVKATAVNGCSAKDTMQVLQTYALPQPTLGPDFSICTGTQQRLDPGAFSAYLWQNGSTAAFLHVSSPGTYHVKVTNANQCSAADTVLLVQLLPSPAGFLAATDSICVFSSAVLSPLQNFTSYLWSTGATQKEITVSTPGNYILTVVNNNGCTGKDTIALYQKECFTGVFVPTAFTPNNDGRNDVFKPVISGTVLQLLFEVYDRAGQLVFSTSNPASGWNGTIQGIQQAAGVYAWQCRYQLAGQSPGYQKGTVMLIR